MNKIYYLTITGFLLISCSKEIIWNAGEDLTRTITLDPYNVIEINSIFDVQLVQDSNDFVKITCGRNLMDRVKVNQNAEVVEISEFSDMNWTRSYRRTLIELHFKELQQIHINDCVKMESKGPFKGQFISVWVTCDLSEVDLQVLCDHFYIMVSEDNFGIYKVSGVTGSSSLELQGTAHFRMENLETDSCHVLHKGIGDCYVNVRNLLKGEITGKGTLLYKTNPALKVQVNTEKGKVIPVAP